MPKKYLICFVFSTLILVSSSITSASELKVSKFFKGFSGTFIIMNTKTSEIKRYNESQSIKRLSPCSSFKIANSLFALETGIIKDENQILKWDGIRRPISAWNSDLSVGDAISVSAVPHFQNIASKIGESRMRKYVTSVNYGNQDISGGIRKFWLGSSLRISAEEQISFLNDLILYKLPVSKRSVDIVKKMILIQKTENGFLYGKTGANVNRRKNESLAWFVGIVESRDEVFVFALNIEAPQKAKGSIAKKITKEILKELDLI
jgi:bla regulator protein blaR1